MMKSGFRNIFSVDNQQNLAAVHLQKIIAELPDPTTSNHVHVSTS